MTSEKFALLLKNDDLKAERIKLDRSFKMNSFRENCVREKNGTFYKAGFSSDNSYISDLFGFHPIKSVCVTLYVYNVALSLFKP